MNASTDSKTEGFLKKNVVNIVSCVIAIVGLGWAVEVHSVDVPEKFGSCGLIVQKPAKAERLRELVNQGIAYGSHRKADLAARTFAEVLRLDPNYLGANLNHGLALMMQNDYPDAQKDFDKELQLVDCMNSIKGRDYLLQFSYVLGRVGDDTSTYEQYKQRLRAAEDLAHYDKASALLKEQEKEGALNELRLAENNHTIKRESVRSDPDLKDVIHTRAFAAELVKFPE